MKGISFQDCRCCIRARTKRRCAGQIFAVDNVPIIAPHNLRIGCPTANQTVEFAVIHRANLTGTSPLRPVREYSSDNPENEMPFILLEPSASSFHLSRSGAPLPDAVLNS